MPPSRVYDERNWFRAQEHTTYSTDPARGQCVPRFIDNSPLEDLGGTATTGGISLILLWRVFSYSAGLFTYSLIGVFSWKKVYSRIHVTADVKVRAYLLDTTGCIIWTYRRLLNCPFSEK